MIILIGAIAIGVVGFITGWSAKSDQVERAEWAAEEEREAGRDREREIERQAR